MFRVVPVYLSFYKYTCFMPLAAVVIEVALVLFYCCRPSFSHNVAKRLWRGQIDKGTLMACSAVKGVISTRGTKTLAWLSQLITTCHARPAMRTARPDNSSQSGGRPIVGPQDISTQGGGQTDSQSGLHTARLQSIHYSEHPAQIHMYRTIPCLTSKSNTLIKYI